MRWQRFFDDLEGMFDWRNRPADAELADLTRRELARVSLLDRLLDHDGPLELVIAGGQVLRGPVAEAGQGWVMVRHGRQRHVIVPFGAILEITGLGRRAGVGGDISRRLTLAHVVRGLARHRCVVAVEDIGGRRRTGTIDVVGADFFELAEHPVEQPRRRAHVVAARVVPFTALACLQAWLDQRESAGSASSAPQAAR